MEFSTEFDINVTNFKKRLNFERSFDVNIKEYVINEKRIMVVFLGGLNASGSVIDVVSAMLHSKIEEVTIDSLMNVISNQQTTIETDANKFADMILSGVIGILVEDSDKGILLDMRSFPGRQPQEPDNEKVVRGSRDGFVENIALNVALVRRRIKTGLLINEIHQVGSESKTDVVISYMDGIADENIVKNIRDKIDTIKTKELTMCDKALDELLVKKPFNPYPLVRYTERPDVVATHLYQGQVAIFVDNSPSVILAPTTFFEHLQHVEEYRQTPVVGTFLRFVRVFGIMLSLFLIPAWMVLINKPEMVPDFLQFLLPDDIGGIPLLMQILMAEIGIEFLRLAAIHTPNAISSAMGVIAGLLVGEIAIKVGLFVPDVVLYVAVSQMGSYVTPSYELALANKISKLFFIVAAYFFGLYGLIFTVLLWLIYLCSLKSFGKHYFSPLFPLNIRRLIRCIIRFPKK